MSLVSRMSKSTLLGLDVGERRIGVASADASLPIAMPLTTISVDGSEVQQIAALVADHAVEKIIVGYPRNQQGELTQQTEKVEAFAKLLLPLDIPIIMQDESLTSVLAQQHLDSLGKPYEKGDIDAAAAAIILQDYLEAHRG